MMGVLTGQSNQHAHMHRIGSRYNEIHPMPMPGLCMSQDDTFAAGPFNWHSAFDRNVGTTNWRVKAADREGWQNLLFSLCKVGWS